MSAKPSAPPEPDDEAAESARNAPDNRRSSAAADASGMGYRDAAATEAAHAPPPPLPTNASQTPHPPVINRARSSPLFSLIHAARAKQSPSTKDSDGSARPALGGDLVALWEIKLSDGLHRVEFEHGTTSGKRIIRVDGLEVKRQKYMFKLVGAEQFSIGGVPCSVSIEAAPNMRYVYKLDVNGQTYDRYVETTGRAFKIWTLPALSRPRNALQSHPSTPSAETLQITLDTQTLDVRVNGQLVETTSEFTDYGSQLSFLVEEPVAGGGRSAGACIRLSTANFQRQGLGAVLVLDNGDQPILPDH